MKICLVKPLIIANWKMNPASVREASALADHTEAAVRAAKNVEAVVAPPFPYFHAVKNEIRYVKLGAQNVWWTDEGPYTGEVSWRQLKQFGVQYVIVGHSERRIHAHEGDVMINRKIHVLLEHGIAPILCIGEQERESNNIPETVGAELKAALENVKRSMIKKLIVAYEPIWAISTTSGSKPDTPANAFQAMVFIRKVISSLYGRAESDGVRVIYGGSVKASNIVSFLVEGKMQGALVGGASLKPKEFREILRNVNNLKSRVG